MGNVTIITNAIGRFANAMRLYGEAFIRIEGWQQSTVKRLSTTSTEHLSKILRVFIRYMMYRKGCLTFMLIRIPVS